MQTLLSIICTSYNHEKFIRQTLDGFVNQKTNFKFEVLIHDDASTDRTPEIIKEYEKKYPHIIKPIYQTENQFSKGVSISKEFNFPRVKGKYVALCEGDDYWIDNNKLQKQVDFLEANPNYSVCFHPVKFIYEDKPNKTNIYPSKKLLSEELTFEKLLQNNFIQTNSVVYRWRFNNEDVKDVIPNGIIPGDWYLHLCHAKVGKIGALKDVMSVYRRHSGGVWSDTDATNKNLHRRHGLKELKMYNSVYENLADKSEKYLNETYLPMFKQIIDVYYNFGDIDKLVEIKSLYPELFEKTIQIQNPMGKKLKKYKKMYSLLLVFSIILLIINILQLFL